MDETSGNNSDSVGSTTLTNTSVTNTSAGKINYGDAYAGAGYSAMASGTVPSGDFSLSMWIKFTNFSTIYQLVADWSLTARNLFIYSDTTGVVTFARGNGGSSQDATNCVTAALSTGTWYHLVFTQASTAKSIYVNAGTPTTATATYTGGATGATAYFGAYQQTSANYLNGTIDEVGLWTRALSSSEVTQLYNGGAGLQYPFTVTKNSVGAAAFF